MYVRYLQHQHSGTVQLLMMPLSTAAGSVKSSKWSDRDSEDNVECEPVPLPIQTFLWRQTNPFLGAKSSKLHDASCVTFERVVVQNILHGLSPSLSDAIASVSRWRFVRAAFPHIIQCSASLLAERLSDDEAIPVSGSLAKILYILHWLLMDAATECNEMTLTESNDCIISVRQLAFSVASIQLFVYLLAPLFHHINEEEIESHIRLESGLRLWQAFWQCRTPDILCFCAPVKQRKTQLPQVTLSKKLPATTAIEQGIYLGDENAAINRRLSLIPQISLTIPPPKPPRTDLNVLREIQQKQIKEKNHSTSSENHMKPTSTSTTNSSIVRSVSDYKTNESAAEVQNKIKKSKTNIFHNSPDYSDSDIFNGLKDIDEAMKFAEDISFSDIFHLNDKNAPLVKLQEICSAASIDNSEHRSNGEAETNLCSSCSEKIMLTSSKFEEKCECSILKEVVVIPDIKRVRTSSSDDSSSVSSKQTIINRERKSSVKVPNVTLEKTWQESTSVHSNDKLDAFVNDPHEANYLDIAVLRCLLIKNWSESGVYWSLQYLMNRLTDIKHYRQINEGVFRSRSNSVPTVAPRLSRHDILEVDTLTWSNLQNIDDTTGKRFSKDSTTEDDVKPPKVVFIPESKDKNKLAVFGDKRRVSVNTLPAIKKMQKNERKFKSFRSKSEPSYSPSFEAEPNSNTKHNSPETNKAKKLQQNYFPEATGSSNFIEKNGHINFQVTLKILSGLIERCNTVRISELVLSLCDILLTMPGIDQTSYFDDITKIILIVYLNIGCPNGCNEGIRTAQADFLRIKAKNLFSQMYKINCQSFGEILKVHVTDTGVQKLLDCIHAVTVYCQSEIGPNRLSKRQGNRRRSSALIQAENARTATYRNQFNESNTGIEGMFIDILLQPLLTKLMKKLNELFLPENMGLYQDVRMFVSYVEENHGNPFRRAALSALATRINTQQEEINTTNDTKSIDPSEADNVSKQGLYVNNSHGKDTASLRRGLFKKKDKNNDDNSEGESSPSTPRDVPTNDDNISNAGSPLFLQQQCSKQSKKSGGKLQFAINLLKAVKNENAEDENWTEDMTTMTPINGEDEENGQGSDSRSNRISFRNAAQKVNYFRHRSSLSAENTSFDAQSEKSADINTLLIQNYLPPKRLLHLLDVREGARRFAFLLETCKPGQVPDAPLLSALSELKAPVLGRAVILLECAHFVHRCNHGDWPEWIRTSNNQSRTIGMTGHLSTTGSGGGQRVTSGSKRTFLIQRAAGRNFYEWALQIGIRLQISLEKDNFNSKLDKKKLKMLDDLENFLDDGTVNEEHAEAIPIALQLMACTVLFQITAFLRETFQSLPRSKMAQKNTGSTSGWEKLMSHRRWSILSNTFNQQGSIHSINDLHPSLQPERRVSYSTADEESSPRGSHEMIEEPLSNITADKKDANNPLNTIRQFASRGRLFSREASLSITDDGGSDRGSTRSRVLKTHPPTFIPTTPHTPHQPPPIIPTGYNCAETGRRLAQGRQRLLKRDTQIGVVPSHSPSDTNYPRKRESSFKLRKQSRSPAASGADMDENESAPLILDSEGSLLQQRRKTTSLRNSTRWNIRSTRIRSPGARPGAPSSSNLPSTTGISTIEGQFINVAGTPGATGPNRQRGMSKTSGNVPYEEVTSPREGTAPTDHFSPERKTIGSYSSSQHGGLPPQQQIIHAIEDEEEEMLKTMPWIKTMIEFSKKFDMTCDHKNFCSRWCFERIYRQCFRLTEAFKVVYDEKSTNGITNDKRKKLIEAWQNKQDFTKQKRVSNPRRESAVTRQSGIERVPLALRGLLIEKLNEIEETKSAKKESMAPIDPPVNLSEINEKRSPMLNFMRTHLLTIAHAPLSLLLKSALIMNTDQYKDIVSFSWSLLIHNDAHVCATAASMFICCSVRCPDDCINIIKENLSSPNVNIRAQAVRRFFSLWRNRFHVWMKMEDGAQLLFKVPPPGIDFTLPSPAIGTAQIPVVDSPWMPHVKTKIEELSLKEEEHSTSQTIMTMTRTRRKQKQEMVKKAIREAEERQCELRQQFPLHATAIVQQAAYEPALFHHQTAQQQQQSQNQQADATSDDDVVHQPQSRHQMPVAQPLFPSAILSSVPQIIEMIDDVQVGSDGISVGDVCRKVIWNCITEDSALFLRHFLEKLTNKEKQEYLIALMRKLVITFKPLPSQTAYVLMNYIFGFVMFYIRSPSEGSDKTLAHALSLVWLIIPYVHGLYFKDMKQTLKKEQCDQALMITANVPSAKKIIVHGPDSSSGGIPSQFPIHEDTQFHQILTDSLEFFNIPENEAMQYFLIDSKTRMIHNPDSYVRDFYFFHRSFYPQLTLIKLNPLEAIFKMKQTAFQQRLIEIGKVLLTHNALKYSPESVIPQRVFFLHDEFTHLPSFPRRSLESSFGMYQGLFGDELHSIDTIHKLVWAKLISDMFEKMENAFMFGDLHLFINVINGILIIHCEDILILRKCMATYLTMAIHFNTLFASQGFFLIMPTILRCYSQRQPNRLFTQIIEFTCKQFYILHRKPFLLQMFGSVAEICDHNNNDLEINAMLVKAKYLFNLVRAMENMTEMTDQLDILSLVPYPKPLKALDLCYRDDPNAFFILTDAMASCVTVCAFAPDTKRSHQMLLIMQALMPYYMQFLEKETISQGNNANEVKHEVHAYSTLCVEIKALINSCETLSRGPTRLFDIVNTVSDRGKSFLAESPQFFDPPTLIEEEGRSGKDKKATQNPFDANIDNSEMEKELFRGPRDALLTLCSSFIEKANVRLKELSKLAASIEHLKVPELLDHKCHVKLSEIAVSLLKIAPYDHVTMTCQGLQKYFLIILPVTDWSVETNRSALNIILRRLDKTITKIAKKNSIRRRANWAAMSNWLLGLYNTLSVYPYIAHLHPLKTITQMCLKMTVGDQCIEDNIPGQQSQNHQQSTTILNSSTPPASFSNMVLKLTSFLMQALGQFAFSLEFVCSNDGIGIASERLEVVLCQILIPLFLRAAMPGKDSSQFQPKDITYCLTIIHNAINPLNAKQSLAPTANANLATSLIRGTVTHDTTGRQGSVSVTDRGHSATVSTHRVIRDSLSQSVFLALKVIILAFHKQMSTHWNKLTKIVKDLITKRVGGQALFNFLDFLISLNLPISITIVPIIYNKLNQKPLSDFEAHWQQEFKEMIMNPKPGSNPASIRGYYTLLKKLSQELQSLKEDFASRLIELPRSHTPTIGDIHSDSGSGQSVSTHRLSHARPFGDSRRLSSSAGFQKMKKSMGPEVPHNIQETTILEDTEDETAQMVSGKVSKSPSLPFSRISTQPRTRSMGGLGMWRSIRRKSRLRNDENQEDIELQDMRRRSFNNKRLTSKSSASDDSIIITPLTMHGIQQGQSEMTASIISKSDNADSDKASSVERQKIVSFSTPMKSQISEADSDEFCITSHQHLI